MAVVSYPIDYTGQAASNLVVNEPQVLTVINDDPFRYFVPNFAPFYVTNFKIVGKNATGADITLKYGIDYEFSMKYIGATRAIGQTVYGGITIINRQIQNMVYVTYQCLGGKYSADRNYVIQTIAENNYNPRMVAWDQVTSIQETFPPTPHAQDLDTFTGLRDLIDCINSLTAKVGTTPDPLKDVLYKHILDENDPHKTLRLVGDTFATQAFVNNVMRNHIDNPDPHPQYFNLARLNMFVENRYKDSQPVQFFKMNL